MITLQDIVDAVKARQIPLPMAIELSEPGLLDQLWSQPTGHERFVDTISLAKMPMASRELLLFTRLDALVDALEAFATANGISSPATQQQASSARYMKSMKTRREWARTIFMGLLEAGDEVGARNIARRGHIVSEATGPATLWESRVWNVVYRLGPPTLEEIVEASTQP